MAISFDFEVQQNLLKVVTYGEDEHLKEAENYARKVLETCLVNGCNKVLCDERKLEYSLSVMDTYALAEGASIEARSIKKIAIVCQEKYLEDGKFYETVSKNRGLTVMVTSDLGQANDWIGEI